MGDGAGITGGTWCAFLQFSSFCGHSLSPPSLGNKQWPGAAGKQAAPFPFVAPLLHQPLPTSRLESLSGH